MASARGILAIGGGVIRFSKEGRWYLGDEVIANTRIARLFSQHVQGDGEGGWVIDVGVDRQAVEVEDTPLVVRSVSGDPEAGFSVKTNDEVCGELDCSSLEVGEGEVLYCSVDRGDRGVLRARFLRPPYYHLMKYLEAAEDGLAISSRGRRFVLHARSDTGGEESAREGEGGATGGRR